jgi:hypothetical protein
MQSTAKLKEMALPICVAANRSPISECSLPNASGASLPETKNGLQDQACSNIRQVLESPQFKVSGAEIAAFPGMKTSSRGVLTISSPP